MTAACNFIPLGEKMRSFRVAKAGLKFQLLNMEGIEEAQCSEHAL